MNSKKVLITLASAAFFMPLFTSTTHAAKLLASIPTHLRGTWYTTDQSGVNKVTLTKKYVVTAQYNHGKKTFSQKAKVIKPWRATIKPYVIVKKGTHGWIGLSWTNANGVMNIKRGTYKFKGHKYAALFNSDWNAGRLGKSVKMSVGFHHPTKKPHYAKLSTKGMFAM